MCEGIYTCEHVSGYTCMQMPVEEVGVLVSR